jgi:hypothetical protein
MGEIAGRITAADTGLPLRRATVRIASRGAPPVPAAITDADGQFAFTGLAPGRYAITARKDGYLPLSFGQRRAQDAPRELELAPAQTLSNIDFALPRGGVIVGRVFDEYGDPLVNAEIVAFRHLFVPGTRVLITDVNTKTNDLGEFRLFGLTPGRYFISASWHGAVTTRGGDEARFGLAPTYYPGTLQLADAAPVAVDAGETVGTLTFSLLSARLATVEGRVVDGENRPVPNATVTLTPRIAGTAGEPSATVAGQPDGSFLIGEVPPGDYDLRASFPPSPAGRGGPALARFRTSGEDVRGIVVSPPERATIAGRVVFDATTAAAAPLPSEIDVVVASDDGAGRSGAVGAPLDGQYRFQFAAMPGLVVVRARVKKPGWLVKAVRVNGFDVTDSGIEAAPGAAIAGVEVELTGRPPQVSGTVVDAAGRPCGDCAILFYPQDEDLLTTLSRFFVLERADPAGAFAARLPAGRYYVAALQSYDVSRVMDPELLITIRPASVPLALTDGEARTLRLRAITP